MLNGRRSTGLSGRQAGFTIIELMIALSILSVLLVSSTIILMQLGDLYTKGVNASNTQNTTRNLVNNISSQLRLSGSAPDLSYYGTGPGKSIGYPTPSVYCIGDQRYTFLLDNEVTSSSVVHALWRDTIIGGGACKPVANFMTSASPSDAYSVHGSGLELLPLRTRLTDFSITYNNLDDTYTIDVGLAYGDTGLLCDSGAPSGAHNSCNSPTDSSHLFPHTGDILCKGQTGSQFCAVSKLKISVGQRVIAQ